MHRSNNGFRYWKSISKKPLCCLKRSSIEHNTPYLLLADDHNHHSSGLIKRCISQMLNKKDCYHFNYHVDKEIFKRYSLKSSKYNTAQDSVPFTRLYYDNHRLDCMLTKIESIHHQSISQKIPICIGVYLRFLHRYFKSQVTKSLYSLIKK